MSESPHTGRIPYISKKSWKKKVRRSGMRTVPGRVRPGELCGCWNTDCRACWSQEDEAALEESTRSRPVLPAAAGRWPILCFCTPYPRPPPQTRSLFPPGFISISLPQDFACEGPESLLPTVPLSAQSVPHSQGLLSGSHALTLDRPWRIQGPDSLPLQTLGWPFWAQGPGSRGVWSGEEPVSKRKADGPGSPL